MDILMRRIASREADKISCESALKAGTRAHDDRGQNGSCVAAHPWWSRSIRSHVMGGMDDAICR